MNELRRSWLNFLEDNCPALHREIGQCMGREKQLGETLLSFLPTLLLETENENERKTGSTKTYKRSSSLKARVNLSRCTLSKVAYNSSLRCPLGQV